jgi:hypothetical protein
MAGVAGGATCRLSVAFVLRGKVRAANARKGEGHAPIFPEAAHDGSIP